MLDLSKHKEKVDMNKAQLIEYIYQMSDEYLATNKNPKSGDLAYELGLKEGIEGFRRYIMYDLLREEK